MNSFHRTPFALGLALLGMAGVTPPSFAQDPVSRRKVEGPTGASEHAVLEALRWLARHQNADGSWSERTLDAECRALVPTTDAVNDEGLTALALLVFLGAGFDTNSEQSLIDLETKKRT